LCRAGVLDATDDQRGVGRYPRVLRMLWKIADRQYRERT